MGAATLIAGKDLRLRVRDRSAFIMGIVTPLALAYIFHLVFGGAFTAEALDLEVGLVDLDNTQVSQSLAEALSGLESEGILALTEFDDATAAQTAIEEGETEAYILLNLGLGDAAIQAQPFTIEVVGDVDSQTTTQVASSIASEFGSAIERSQLSVTTAIALGEGPSSGGGSLLGRGGGAPTPALYLHGCLGRDPATRRQHVLRRRNGRVLPLLHRSIRGSRATRGETERNPGAAARGADRAQHCGGGQGNPLVLTRSHLHDRLDRRHPLLDGARWGPPLGVALLVIAGVLAATSIMGVIAATATSADGAANLGAIIAVILGMLGGTFFPIGQGNDLLARLSYLTPHAWFMRGLSDISGGAEWTEVLPAVGALLLFTLVFGTVAWVLLQRKLTQ